MPQKEDVAGFERLCRVHGLTMSDGTADQLSRYADTLISWNARVRLVSRSDSDRVLSRHVFDSLLVLDHLPDAGSLADVGTGGGLPGIPIQIASPSLHVTLIESARMKCLFLKEVVRSLGLDRAEVVHERAERVAEARGGTFDVVTARAVAKLDRVWALAGPLLRPGGRLVALKGPGEAEQDLGSRVAFTESVVQVDDGRPVAVVVVERT